MPKSRQYKACFIGTVKSRIQELLILKKTFKKLLDQEKEQLLKC